MSTGDGLGHLKVLKEKSDLWKRMSSLPSTSMTSWSPLNDSDVELVPKFLL